MIKKFYCSLSLILLVYSCKTQTNTEWQQDLEFLRHTVNNKYPNLFHTISAEAWNKSVDSLKQQVPTMQRYEVIAGITKLVAAFHIGHTGLNIFENDHGGTGMFNRIPVRFYLFRDGLFVTAADKIYEKMVGGKVVKIGNLSTEKALEAIRPVVNYENEQGFLQHVPRFLRVPELLSAQKITTSMTEVPITWLKNGKEETIVVKVAPTSGNADMRGMVPAGWTEARKAGDEPLWKKKPGSFRYMEYLPASKTLYVKHAATLNQGEETIEKFFKEMTEYIKNNDVQKLVLDIRLNGGGNNYLNKPIITSIIRSEKINQKGKFFVIIGRQTFSAAQNLVNELEKYTEVTFAGEPTSENVNFFGDIRREILPNSKIPVLLSWLWWQNLDPRDKRKATNPHLAADMSFEEYYSNVDPVLDAVLNYTTSRPYLQTISSLLKENKMDEAYKFGMEYRTNPLHKYAAARMNDDINAEGYTRINANKLDEGKALFELNIRLFPESANAYDSYAESLLLMGKKEDAIKYYQIAIEKDKDGATAENAKRALERIKMGH